MHMHPPQPLFTKGCFLARRNAATGWPSCCPACMGSSCTRMLPTLLARHEPRDRAGPCQRTCWLQPRCTLHECRGLQGPHQQGVEGLAGLQVALVPSALFSAFAQGMDQFRIVDPCGSAQGSNLCLQSLPAGSPQFPGSCASAL